MKESKAKQQHNQLDSLKKFVADFTISKDSGVSKTMLTLIEILSKRKILAFEGGSGA